MSEYIEREALLKEAESRIMWNHQAAGVAVYEAIQEAPAADVVEVVRCSECNFNVANMEIDPLDGTDYSGRDIVCGRFLTDGMMPDDFCSYGERKGSADNGNQQ